MNDYEITLAKARGWAGRNFAALDKLMGELLARLRAGAPRGKGKRHGADSIRLFRAERGEEVVYRFYANKPIYWTVVGTSAHVIKPRTSTKFFTRKGKLARRGGVLAFEVSGETHFAKFVTHPGTAPQPWLENAVRKFNLPRYLASRGGE